MKRHLLLSLILLGLVALPPAAAQSKRPPAHNFITHLTGKEEVPPRDTRAQGVAAVHLSKDGTKLHFIVAVVHIRNVVAAHIHNGAAGVNGPVVVTLFTAPPNGGPTNGILAHGTVVRGEDLSAEAFDALVAAMRAGNTYINVHTNDGVAPPNTGPGDFPGGEIRGQLRPIP
jgi:hypothetical protein